MSAESRTDVRNGVLTVGMLVERLRQFDPDAKVLMFENNSFAYISQFAGSEKQLISSVENHKKMTRARSASFYAGSPDATKKIEKDQAELYRYASDNDVIVDF